MFAMSAQRVEKLVWKVLEILAPLMKNEFVCEVRYFIHLIYQYIIELTFVSFYFYHPLVGEYG